MRLRYHREFEVTLVVVAAAIVFFSFIVKPLAQTRPTLPAPTNHVNDLAAVLDENTKKRLENILENVKQRSKIDFFVATVEDTTGQDIFEFSRQLAHDWDIAARTTTKKSLLLVVSVNGKTSFTQFSRSVQSELPEGVLGEMSQRMRAPLAAGRFSEAIDTGIAYFVNRLAAKLEFNLQDMDQPAPIVAGLNTAASTPTVAVAPVPSATIAPEIKAAPNIRIEPPAPLKKPAPLKRTTAADDEAEAEDVELTLTLPLEARIQKLKEFLDKHPTSKARPRAMELLISARAALGDQKLSNADSAGGVELLMMAIDSAPVDMSDKLFSGVISQIPLNLYLRGERAAALKAAQNIESKFGNDARRSLAIAGFYIAIEQGDEVVRLAAQAVKLAPNMAEAHRALGLGLLISLRLDEAAAEYKRALELDPNLKGTRRSLADLYRGAGKAEQALTLYRQQLTADPADKAARAGLVLALLDLGRTEEANTELDAALKDDARNLALLTGAAYWFVAHADSEKALDLARRAVEIEPRYTWAQIAAARALIAQKKPLAAERSIRFARQYGKFPTLDYELANVLASAGLYEEAAEVLQQSFVLRDKQIETRLGGRRLTQELGFIELLAPERRASIFQAAPADDANNARMLKALLAFTTALNPTSEGAKIEEAAVVTAARDFASFDDQMRVYRQLYVVSRMLRKGAGLQAAYELAEEARKGIDGAIDVPTATVAVQADEFREIRARIIAAGGTPNIADLPHDVLSSLLRGRIEDLSGWALFNQDKTSEAIGHLRSATNILPEGTPSWRTALWHLGAALEQSGNHEEALNSYIRSYLSGERDPVRRQVIEQLYRKVNGSLDGLEQRIGPGPSGAAREVSPQPTPDATTKTAASAPEPVVSQTPTEKLAPTPQPSATVPAISPEASPTPLPDKPTAPASVTPTPAPSPADVSKTTVPETAPSPEPSPAPTPETTPAPSSKDQSAQTPAPSARDTETQPSPNSEQSLAQAASRLRTTIRITGRVTDANNNGIANVVVVLISPRGTVLAATTDAEGNYSFNVSPSQHAYRFIPSKEGYTFEPVDRALTAFSEDRKDVDFVGAIKKSP